MIHIPKSHLLKPLRCCAELMALTALFTLAACSAFSSPTASAVGQGLRYQPGNERFDAFFAKLHALQVSLAEAPEHERELRAELAKALEVKAGATAGLLVEEIRNRTVKIRQAGLKTRLDIEGDQANDPLDVSATLRVSGGSLSRAQQRFSEAVVRAIRQELRLMAARRGDARQLERLLALSTLLEDRVDEEFRVEGPAKRSEVRKNLEDARKLIPLMIVSARDLTDNMQKSLRGFEDAITTDAGDPVAQPLVVSEPELSPAAPASEPEPEEAEPFKAKTSKSKASKGKASKAKSAKTKSAGAKSKPGRAARPQPRRKPSAPRATAPATDFEP